MIKDESIDDVFGFGDEDDLTITDMNDSFDEEPISASACIERINLYMTKDALAEYTTKPKMTPPIFARLVMGDIIPFTFKNNSRRKVYRWNEVAHALDLPTLAQMADAPANSIDQGDDTVEVENNGEKIRVKKSIFEEYRDRLIDELAECISPMERMNVTDKFWGSLFKEFKLKVQMGAYIEIASVTEVLDSVLPNTRDALYKIAPTIAQRYPTVTPDVIEAIHDAVSTALGEVQDVLCRNPNTHASEFINPNKTVKQVRQIKNKKD